MSIGYAFAPVPVAVLHTPELSPGAKTLFGILQSHARGKGHCEPGYARLCALLARTENTVRAYVRELVAAGLVVTLRRGYKQTNRYVITTRNTPCMTPLTGGDDPQFLRAKEIQSFSRGEDSRAIPLAVDLLPNPAPEAATPAPTSAPARTPPCPAPLAQFADDIGRQCRDDAPASTRTRIARLHAASGLDVPTFYERMGVARAITLKRWQFIRRRSRGGEALPMPYFLQVLAERVGLAPARTPRPRHMPREALETHGEKINPHVEITPSEAPVMPSRSPDEEERERERAAFWTAISVATHGEITNMRDYCRLANRPPIVGDFERSMSYLRWATGRAWVA